MKIKIPENIAAIKPYIPGKPQDELEREMGITGSIKLASNENPWGPSPKAVRAIRSELFNLHRYPDGSCYSLVIALAQKLGVDPMEVVLGNGSNEIIDFLVKAFVQERDEVVTSHPSFLVYQKFVQVRGGINYVVPLRDMQHDLPVIKEMVSDKTRLIFLDNPNNPTGTTIAPVKLYQFLSEIPETVIVVLDEAYIDFADKQQRVDIYSLIRNKAGRCPVVFLRTFSKVYGLAGLRIGYALMAREVAFCLQKVRPPFNINQMAQVGALAALGDEEYYERTLSRTREGLGFLCREVDHLGCKRYPSQANFFLIDVQGNADLLYNTMLTKGVIVRSMSAYGFENFIRVSVGTEEENKRFIKALADSLVELKYV
ncbi:MAG: histidinol-phosphate transaminase [Proteobacteria bacterium]|nr:histidinol-phosphate transaminase [Pseudomonadota bacterium]